MAVAAAGGHLQAAAQPAGDGAGVVKVLGGKVVRGRGVVLGGRKTVFSDFYKIFVKNYLT